MIYSTPEVKIEVFETEDIILASLGQNETPLRPASVETDANDSASVLGLR